MILPTKHISVENSLIGLGGIVLQHIGQPIPVSLLWDEVRELPEVATFERFTLSLDLLFIMNIIEFRDNKIRRVAS